jgi:hypothetical protein
MNDNDIFKKSDLGREAIKNQSMSVLPREARTLLIMIDGKKTYQHYFESLDKGKMFVDTGGIAPFFEMLQDLEYIELAGHASEVTMQMSPAIPQLPQTDIISERQVTEAPKPSEPSRSQSNSEAEFDVTFNSPKPKKTTAIGRFFTSKASGVSYETLKSELATYIEKNAPPQDAWGYLLNLEQCSGASQLLELTQKIQKSTSGDLSRSMEDFSKKIKRQL